MCALKKKNLRARAQGDAAALPLMMQSVAPTMGLYPLPTEELQSAPEGWNFYKPLPADKFQALCQSIVNFGLLHPVVIWQRENGEKHILSGHNRVRAFQALYAQTGEEKYAAIPCSVKTELDPEDAYEILIDSNWMQRELSPSERAHSIAEKYRLAGRKHRENDPSKQGRTYEQIAGEYGISGRQVHRYIQLYALPSALIELVDQEKLSMQAGLHLAALPEETKDILREPDALALLTNKLARRIPEHASPEQALTVLMQAKYPEASAAEQYVTLRLRIPVTKRGEFLAMARQWGKENGIEI